MGVNVEVFGAQRGSGTVQQAKAAMAHTSASFDLAKRVF